LGYRIVLGCMVLLLLLSLYRVGGLSWCAPSSDGIVGKGLGIRRVDTGAWTLVLRASNRRKGEDE